MRRILLATAALAFFGVGSAMAADSVDVEITAEQAPICTIVTHSPSLALQAVDEVVPGVFSYTCNFAGSPTFTFVSALGGVSNGSDVVDYGIYLNDIAPSTAPSTWQQASTSTTPGSVYPGISFVTPANAVKAPSFAVGLSAPLPVAGSYADTLTISVSP